MILNFLNSYCRLLLHCFTAFKAVTNLKKKTNLIRFIHPVWEQHYHLRFFIVQQCEMNENEQKTKSSEFSCISTFHWTIAKHWEDKITILNKYSWQNVSTCLLVFVCCSEKTNNVQISPVYHYCNMSTHMWHTCLGSNSREESIFPKTSLTSP